MSGQKTEEDRGVRGAQKDPRSYAERGRPPEQDLDAALAASRVVLDGPRDKFKSRCSTTVGDRWIEQALEVATLRARSRGGMRLSTQQAVVRDTGHSSGQAKEGAIERGTRQANGCSRSIFYNDKVVRAGPHLSFGVQKENPRFWIRPVR